MKEKPIYKNAIDDPHYDPPDPYYKMFSSERPTRTKSGEMTKENREAMIKVLFSDVVKSTPSTPAPPLKPSPLLISSKNILQAEQHMTQDNLLILGNIAEEFKDSIDF